jgi:hypothetical protein
MHRISVENGWYALRREPMGSAEPQCVEKIFCMSRLPPEGGGRKSKIENRKIKNCKIGKIENRNFWLLTKGNEKPKIRGIARAFLTTIAEAKRELRLGGFSIPPLTALYWL